MPEQLITFHFKMESAGNPAMPRIGMQTTNCAMQAIRLIPFLIAVVSHKKQVWRQFAQNAMLVFVYIIDRF